MAFSGTLSWEKDDTDFFSNEKKKAPRVAAPFAFDANVELPLLSDIGHQRNAEALSLNCFDDADDDQNDEANPDRATKDVNTASEYRHESKDDLKNHPANLRAEKSQSILGVPLKIGVVFFHQQRNQPEKAEVRQNQEDGSVAAARRDGRRS
jgi:hypothetical protein